MPVNLKKYFAQTYRKITIPESRTEKEAILYWLFENKLKASRTEILTEKLVEVDTKLIDSMILRINSYEPIQYILGESIFMGRTFFVNPSVLVPRPETEWMTNEVINKYKNIPNLKLMDIGTGSGCIAVTLKLELDDPIVYATDFSSATLDVSRKNATQNQASIYFYESDILLEDIPTQNLDIIVSNPPYILNSEKKSLSPNVINYEPESALFVPEEDPFIFYRNIALKSMKSLKSGGSLITEINELYGQEITTLFEQAGFEKVRIIKDLLGKDRMVWGMKKG